MRAAKILLAIFLGAPLTLFFLPWLVPATLNGPVAAVVDLMQGRAGNARASLMFAVWAGAGLCGLVGFWAWVFTDQSRSRRAARWIGGLLVIGVLAIAPITVPAVQSGHPDGWLIWMAVAGSGLALAVALRLLWQGPAARIPGAR